MYVTSFKAEELIQESVREELLCGSSSLVEVLGKVLAQSGKVPQSPLSPMSLPLHFTLPMSLAAHCDTDGPVIPR